MEKRSTYFKYADHYIHWPTTWLLVWDGDFELAPKDGYTMSDVELEFKELRNNTSANEVSITLDVPYTPEDTKGSRFHLGFRDTPGLSYKNNHFCIYNKDGKEVKDTMPSVDLQKCRILHWHLDKPQSRIDERSYYSSRISKRYEK
jgi:hypothetical protein